MVYGYLPSDEDEDESNENDDFSNNNCRSKYTKTYDVESAKRNPWGAISSTSTSSRKSISQKRNKRRRQLMSLIFNIVQVIFLPLGMLRYYFIYGNNNNNNTPPLWLQAKAMKYISLALCILCYAAWVVARLQLGSNFSVLPKADGPLLTTGCYRRLSNPIYVFGTLGLLSFAVLLGDIVMMAVVVIIIVPVQIWRARRERVMLRDKFGNDYDEYIRTVWF